MSKPVLLMLPGFDGTGDLFKPLVTALGDAVDCLPVAYQDFPNLAGYEQYVLDICPQDRPVVLLAESFSGPIGLNVLAQAPANFIGGVFSATFAKPPLALIISLAEKLKLASLTLPGVSEQILRWFCLNGVRDIGLIRDITAVVRAVEPETVQSRLSALTTMDAGDAVCSIEVPIMTFAASQDRIIRRRYMQSLLDAGSHRQHEVIDGPHLLLQASADQSAAKIVEFIANIT
ncbi:MAG: alpha/beta fold hydrolase [Woeseiaceae bacterium]